MFWPLQMSRKYMDRKKISFLHVDEDRLDGEWSLILMMS